jgi:hypothetical protein
VAPATGSRAQPGREGPTEPWKGARRHRQTAGCQCSVPSLVPRGSRRPGCRRPPVELKRAAAAGGRELSGRRSAADRSVRRPPAVGSAAAAARRRTAWSGSGRSPPPPPSPPPPHHDPACSACAERRPFRPAPAGDLWRREGRGSWPRIPPVGGQARRASWTHRAAAAAAAAAGGKVCPPAVQSAASTVGRPDTARPRSSEPFLMHRHGGQAGQGIDRSRCPPSRSRPAAALRARTGGWARYRIGRRLTYA